MFNSRNPIHRNPVGAVKQGQNIHFKISMPRDLSCSAATLILQNDRTKEMIYYGMFWCGMNGNEAEWWECDFAPSEIGLYFYHFEVQTWNGRRSLSRGMYGEALFGEGRWWQLTVYDSSFETPQWLSGGILYQIFPDRFFCSGIAKKEVPLDREMHTQWGDTPQWEPDASGKITNKDYFGGDLKGIEQKLDYLKSLHVSCIYLNPIFESHSNHRYDTADYSKIDPLLGNEEDFRSLCKHAEELGIRILLDGVFSHTGSDSIYFNRENRYSEPGAYQSKESPYYPWYHFENWPNQYDCWWGFLTLPNVCETNPSYQNYINGKDGIIQKWLSNHKKSGACGWRLDVADELPDEFLDSLRIAAKTENPQAVILGEVWEDASNKSAYGVRRRYLLGHQLDSVMNYPFRNAILGFLTGADPSEMMEIILDILENYPPQVIRLLMNHIGTHDTERVITVLAGEPVRKHGRKWQNMTHLTKQKYEIGLKKMRLASLMQYTLPGVPCIYYGDEAGLEGYKDPFNRFCYPWGKEQISLIDWYRQLGKIRTERSDIFSQGAFSPVAAENHYISYLRQGKNREVFIALNADDKPYRIKLPAGWEDSFVLVGEFADGMLSPYGYLMLERRLPTAEK